MSLQLSPYCLVLFYLLFSHIFYVLVECYPQNSNCKSYLRYFTLVDSITYNLHRVVVKWDAMHDMHWTHSKA